MSFLSDTDKWFSRFRNRRGEQADSESADGDVVEQPKRRSDKDFEIGLDLSDLDQAELVEDLGGHLNIPGDPVTGDVRIFGKFRKNEIEELMDWSGIFEELRRKGFDDFQVDLQYLSELDQRIFVKENDHVLIHIRLKLANFRFRLHPGAPRKKFLYIDWLMTANPRARNFRPERLFPGQDLPGLGIFNQLSDFIANLAIGVGARGAFNIPEYFHDAMLFHRQFNFYDPLREAFFRAVIRDLRHQGARRISRAFSEGRILDLTGKVIEWTPGEMLSILSPDVEEMVWSREYFTRVVRELKRIRIRMLDESEKAPVNPTETRD
ncbi:MAG: hypothetical protein KDK27_15930 [Leptospiraceae bacterium]|nr:hypothetical protein [Leptospiraceae bacterium]